MAFKNYYKTLGVNPDSSQDMIKKKFRLLAQQYHPDKNAGHEFATAQFREIQEAYEILSNPSKRKQYYFEWKSHCSPADNYYESNNDPSVILNDCIRINKEIDRMDRFRINKDSIFRQLNEILSESNINLLLFHKDEKLNSSIITQILAAARAIPFRHITSVTNSLITIAGTDHTSIKKITTFNKTTKRQYYWEKNYPLLVLLITLSICILIYRLSE